MRGRKKNGINREKENKELIREADVVINYRLLC